MQVCGRGSRFLPEFDQQRLDLARAIQSDLAQERTLSALQARSFVRCLQTDWNVETIQWFDRDSDSILQQARYLIRAGRVLSTVGEGHPEEASLAFRRAGELLEWLSRARDKVGEEIPAALIAAGCYQLGGLPAMASGLLRQVEHDDRGSRLFAYFLKADFDAVLRRAASFWRDNRELTRRGVERQFFGEGAEESVTWFGTVELVRCIGLAAQTLRRGDTARFTVALDRLRDVERLLVRTSPDDVALLAFFLRSACARFGKSTIWGQNKSSPKSYAKGEQIENLCDPPQPGWHTKRSKSVRHLMFGIPGVDAGKVDVFPTERRDVLRQSIRNVSTRSLQLCDCTVEIDGIPMDDRTDDEVETRGAERLALERPVANLASLVEEDSAFELMGGLTFVETRLASPP